MDYSYKELKYKREYWQIKIIPIPLLCSELPNGDIFLLPE